MARNTSTSPYRLYDEGAELERKGSWEQAETTYRTLLGLPDLPHSLELGSWFRTGICRAQAGALEEAIECYRRSMALAEVWPEAYAQMLLHLGLALQKTGHYCESARRLEAVRALMPVRGINVLELEAATRRSRVLAGEWEEDNVLASSPAQAFLDQVTWSRGILENGLPEGSLQGARFVDLHAGAGAAVLGALELGASLAVGVTPPRFHNAEAPVVEAGLARGIDLTACVLERAELAQVEFGPPGFDVALLLDAAETSFEPNGLIQAAHKALRPGGILLIESHNLFFSISGHGLGARLPQDKYPWVHLYRDAKARLNDLYPDSSEISRILHTQPLTHGAIRRQLVETGFSIVDETEAAKNPAHCRAYEDVKHLIDPARVPEHEDLWRDTARFLARKT